MAVLPFLFAGSHVEPGEWYFPPIASLITGGAHLFLAMLERCITDKGGHYLFCDTDSMCIVASKDGGTVSCPNEPTIKALTRKDVEEITARFESLHELLTRRFLQTSKCKS